MKKLLALLFCAALVLSLCSCKSSQAGSSDVADTSSVGVPKTGTVANPLTGLQIKASLKNTKPVAVMINNISIAQKVQTGLSGFDVIYETEVEGGITRMMGVAKDPAALAQVGTVRSARYPYLDLALGHDATYVHAGFDSKYFGAHRTELGIKTFDINSGATAAYGFRQSNGLSSEHTLYTTGAKLTEGRNKLGWDETTDVTKWIDFSTEAVALTNPCTSVKVPFSGSYVTGFDYDAASGKYVKSSSGTVRTDYLTGEKLSVKNVFVLITDIHAYPDGYHMEVSLSGGSGYYISNGSCEPITWQKGSATSPLTFKKADGSAFTANAGNSYICIIDSDQAGGIALTAPAEQ